MVRYREVRNMGDALLRKGLTFIVVTSIILSMFTGLQLEVSAAITKETAPFTYTGNWDIVEYETGKWYARFLTSGVFTPKSNLMLDVFLVGGGGRGGLTGSYNTRGGGGGYTKNVYNVATVEKTSVSVTIGVGGAPAGGTSYFGANSAAGAGNTASTYGNGGSGGSECTSSGGQGNTGGSNGGNGLKSTSTTAGLGQGSSTRPFGGDKAPFKSMIYAGGGGGGGYVNGAAGGGTAYGGAGGAGGGGTGGTASKNSAASGSAGSANTGGGGGGGSRGRASSSGTVYTAGGGNGGSGIVIIRNVDSPPLAPEWINMPSDIEYDKEYEVTWAETTTQSTTSVLEGYWLECQTNGGTWTRVADVKVGEGLIYKTIHARNEITTINYRVCAYSDTYLQSGYATGVQCTVINNLAPTIPKLDNLVSPVNGWSTSSFNLKWSAVTDPEEDSFSYTLEQAINEGVWTQVTSNLTVTQYTANMQGGGGGRYATV